MKLFRNLAQRTAGIALGASLMAGAALGLGCTQDPDVFKHFTEGKVFAGGIEVDAKTLNDGHEAYMLYCYACHGTKGDGTGPSSYGLRPPPRDFTKGIFKFARVRSSDELPHDEDLVRIVKGGLHGTAMLPWDIPDVELAKIIQYIKTFAPQKWEKKTRKGEPVKTLEPFAPAADPWVGKEADAIKLGKELYHLRAECMTCHPAYDTKENLYTLSVEAEKREPDKFKAIASFREDMYQPVAKDSPEYKVKILPPDFLLNPVRSIHPETRAFDLFRLMSFGVYPIMPAWKGAGLSDGDIWALAHYVKSLLDMKGTKEARQLREAIASQPPFQVPAKVEEPKPAEGEGTTGEGEKTDEKGEEKKGDEKKGEKAEEKKAPEKPAGAKQPAEPPGARAQPKTSPPITPKPGGGDDTY
jgi:mono/diheme cytochrome c family protein